MCNKLKYNELPPPTALKSQLHQKQQIEAVVKKERDSNVELLRILAISMVLVMHTRFDGILSVYDGVVDASHIMRFAFEAFSIIGVNLFVLISGYYKIKLRPRSVANLVFQVYYFAAVAFVGLIIINKSFSPHTPDYLKLLLPLSHNVWFVPAYFMLMIMAPMLNSFIEKQPTRRLMIYTGILYVITYIWNNIWECISGFGGYGWAFFIVLYLSGACIRRISDKNIVPKGAWLAGYIVLSVLIVVVALAQNYSPVGQSLLWAYDCPLVFASSICFFMIFEQLRMRHSKLINTLAASAFAVLLFHMSACSGYSRFCRTIYENYSGLTVIALTAAVVVCYLFISFILDQPRKMLFTRIARSTKWLNKSQP